MPLTAGTRLGPYEILSALGEGGMGEVYRARDTRLGRDVAVKVLHSSVALDADRLRRFEQEARAAAALNHPNILAVFDIGHADPANSSSSGSSGQAVVPYIVSELLEGQTLREQLVGGPLPVRRAVDLAVQIAQGLAAAHDKGIIHRDLKPENVFITGDGRAKILDFGLAKLKTGEPGGVGDARSADPTQAPTMHTGSPHTEPGLVFGTVGYMAPEQVRGQAVDARTDIFAFGAVLYELLTGARAFQRETAAETMTAILKEDPPALQSDVSPIPPALRRIVDRCLAKNPSGRFKSADDLAFALGSPADSSGPKPSESAASAAKAVAIDEDKPRRRDRKRPRGTVFYRVLAVLAVVALWRVVPALVRRIDSQTVTSSSPDSNASSTAASGAIQLQFVMPDGITLLPWQAPAISPDGSRIALVAVDDASGKRQIYIRSLGNLATQAVLGTTRALYPFWSPDGQRLAFFAEGRLKALEFRSGVVQDMGPAPSVAGPGWWTDDAILFPGGAGPLLRISLKDSTRHAATQWDSEKEGSQYLVGVVADRRRFVFGSQLLGARVSAGNGSVSSALDIAAPRGVLDAPWNERGDRFDGHLLYIRDSTLFVQPFDGAQARPTGESRVLLQNISMSPTGLPETFSVQPSVLAYIDSSTTSSRLVWVDRRGRELASAASLRGVLRDPRISPDGKSVAIGRMNTSRTGTFDLTLLNLARDTTSKLTSELSVSNIVWQQDGSAVVAAAVEAGRGSAIYRFSPAEGSKPVQLTHDAASAEYAPDVSRDRRTLIYTQVGRDGFFGLATKSVDSTGEGTPLPTTAEYSSLAHFSPDGRWVAYQSNESGTIEIYVRSFPDGRDKQQVSTNGGLRPAWRRDGSELFYLTPDGDLVAAQVSTTPTLTVGKRETLFRAPIDPTFVNNFGQPFDVSADGQRFLMVVPTTEVRRPVNVILNWQALLKK